LDRRCIRCGRFSKRWRCGRPVGRPGNQGPPEGGHYG
jgi:hypothetical protein